MTRPPPDGAVEKSFGAAQQQAAAMAGPPPPWNTARTHRGAARWVGLALASLAAGGVAGWLGMRGPGASTAAGPAPLPGPGAALGAPSAPISPAPETVPVQPVPVAPPLAETSPSLDVTRRAGVIHIKASNASLAEVMRALAQATHTTVRGAEALLSIPTPITLDWQGSDPAAAWNLLLGRFASTAVSCSSTACELWVVGVDAPQRAGGLPTQGQGTIGAAAPPPPVVVAAPPPPPAAPANSEENTETN